MIVLAWGNASFKSIYKSRKCLFAVFLGIVNSVPVVVNSTNKPGALGMVLCDDDDASPQILNPFWASYIFSRK